MSALVDVVVPQDPAIPQLSPSQPLPPNSATTDFELEDGFTLSGLNVRLATQTAVTSALPRLPAQTISLLVDVIIKSAARREVALLDVALDHGWERGGVGWGEVKWSGGWGLW